MKLKILATALLGILPGIAPLRAEEAPAAKLEHPVQPLLWKVEGKELKKPSWLFGTIHVGTPPVDKLHPAAAKALDGADAVYTEVPMDMQTQLGLTMHFIRKDGRTLKDSIGPELSKQLDAELKAIQPALNADPFQSFKTWTIGIMLPMLKEQLGGKPALDQIIWQTASKAGKTTGALEKPADQFAIFDDLTEQEQVILLSESLKMLREGREKGEDSMQVLIDAYVSGDPAELEKVVDQQFEEIASGEHRELGEKLMKRLLDDRNVGMAEGIDAFLKEKPGQSHFFAVGAAHYLGRANVRELLTKRGYKVTRVTE